MSNVAFDFRFCHHGAMCESWYMKHRQNYCCPSACSYEHQSPSYLSLDSVIYCSHVDPYLKGASNTDLFLCRNAIKLLQSHLRSGYPQSSKRIAGWMKYTSLGRTRIYRAVTFNVTIVCRKPLSTPVKNTC